MPKAPPAQTIQLTVRRGADAPLVVEVPADRLPFSVGGRKSCDLALQGAGVQPLHGYLDRLDGGLVFRSPALTTPIQLEPGEAFQVGEFEVRLDRVTHSPAAEAAHRAFALARRLLQTADEAGDDGVAGLVALLEYIQATLNASWVALLAPSSEAEEPEYLCQVGQRAGDPARPISRTVLRALRAGGGPVAARDVRTDDRFRMAPSMAEGMRVDSVLAAEVRRGAGLAAIVYAEGNRDRGPFRDLDREAVGEICDFASELLGRAAELGATRGSVGAWRRLQQAAPPERRTVDLVGQCPGMTKVRAELDRAAAVDISVLLRGETGTGKEVAARYLHVASARRDGPFVPLNCAAIPPQLFESELFGCEAGAFSGAEQSRPGRIELAAGGTLFLDEIGDLPLEAQPKLLRVLETRQVFRVGARGAHPVDFRLVCASHRDLKERVAAGRFREDLFYRISVFGVELPPLRERGADVLLLAEQFRAEFEVRYGRGIREFSGATRAALTQHGWPGNVRELRNLVEQAYVRATAPRIEPGDFTLASSRGDGEDGQDVDTELGLEEARRVFEVRLVRRVLAEVDGVLAAAAERLKISRQGLHKKCQTLEIDPAEYR